VVEEVGAAPREGDAGAVANEEQDADVVEEAGAKSPSSVGDEAAASAALALSVDDGHEDEYEDEVEGSADGGGEDASLERDSSAVSTLTGTALVISVIALVMF
jgi:hypothetical protein